MATSPAADARRIWQSLEPLHGVTYFVEDCAETFRDVGLRGFWMAYFAGRAAPLGPVGPGLVTALFFSFEPSMVSRSLPDAWSFAEPDTVLGARLRGVDRALRRLLPDRVDTAEIAEAAHIARMGAEAGNPAGRPLFAANADLAWPDEPHLVLWHAATMLREHRGDGHLAVLASEGLSVPEILVLRTAQGAVPRELFQAARGWDDDAWEEATHTARSNGWIDSDERLSSAGADLLERIEARTDHLAGEPWTGVDESERERLVDIAHSLAVALANSGELLFPNPIGLAKPT